LQNLTIIHALKDEAAKNISYVRRNDDFSSLLSKAAKDTTLLYAVVRTAEDNVTVRKEEPGKEEPKPILAESVNKDSSVVKSLQTIATVETKNPDSTATISSDIPAKKEEVGVVIPSVKEEDAKKDSIVFFEPKEQPKQLIDSAADNNSIAIEKKPDSTVRSQIETESVFKRSKIKKHSESSTSEGFGLVYYDNYDGVTDTVRLIIPNPPVVFKQQDQDSSLLQKDFIHVDELKKDTQPQTIVVAVKNNSSGKSQCKSIASNNDFFKLRKNMASENTDEGMVSEAKKVFKTKCFTTEQVKNLSALFLTSAGKYQFYDAAYLHVSDLQNFANLETEIKDEYYLKRFRALIGE